MPVPRRSPTAIWRDIAAGCRHRRCRRGYEPRPTTGLLSAQADPGAPAGHRRHRRADDCRGRGERHRLRVRARRDRRGERCRRGRRPSSSGLATRDNYRAAGAAGGAILTRARRGPDCPGVGGPVPGADHHAVRWVTAGRPVASCPNASRWRSRRGIRPCRSVRVAAQAQRSQQDQPGAAQGAAGQDVGEPVRTRSPPGGTGNSAR